MGKLLKQIEATKVNTGGFQSSVDKAIGAMVDDDKDDLLCALRNKTISPSVIVDVLEQNGVIVTRHAVNRWRIREGV